MHLKSLLAPIHHPNERHASLCSSRRSQAANKNRQELIFHSHIADAADRTRDTSPGSRLTPAKICFTCAGEYQTNSPILGCWRSFDAGIGEYILRLVFLLLLLASLRVGREMKGEKSVKSLSRRLREPMDDENCRILASYFLDWKGNIGNAVVFILLELAQCSRCRQRQ